MKTVFRVALTLSALACLPTLSYAQNTVVTVAQPVYSVQTMDPRRPFGTIEVVTIGPTTTDLSGFVNGLSQTQAAELNSRCDVIIAAPTTFDGNAQGFCHAYQVAVLNSPNPTNGEVHNQTR